MIKKILKNKKARTALKFLTALVTAGIIAMLIISGPAQALTLSMVTDRDHATAGETVNFDIEVNVDNNEFSEISSLTFSLEGSETIECVFNVYGQPMSQCNGITISPTITETGGYGYLSAFGYGYGKEIKYRISVNTQNLSGNYNSSIRIVYGQNVIINRGVVVYIQPNQNNGNETANSTTRTYSSGVYRHLEEFSTAVERETTKKLSVSEGQRFRIISDNGWYDFEIGDINREFITLNFGEESINLEFQNERNIDLNSDDENELSMNLLYIGENKATMYVDAYNSRLVEKKIVKDIPQKYIKQISQPAYYQNQEIFNIWPAVIIAFANLILLELIGIAGIVKKRKRARKVKRTVIQNY